MPRYGRSDLLSIPNLLRILLDAAVRAKESHPSDSSNGLRKPLVLVLVRLVNEFLRIDVALEVVGDQVIISVVRDAVDEGAELGRIAEHAFADDFEDAREEWVELEVAVPVRVAQVFDVLSEVAEEEDIVFADFSCDLEVVC
jgi:hypothetical protein